MESMVRRKGEILASIPAFLDVMEWVEVHWSSERGLRPPAGTIPRDSGVRQEVVQPDSMAAASRLYLAAARYGAEEVATHATRFASHGMVETQNTFLLRGQPPKRVIDLDDHTVLIPYREAMSDGELRRLASDSGQRDFWPPDGATDVYILRTTVFENKGRWIGEPEQHISPLLRLGIEPLVLLLGLVWGVGLRPFGGLYSIPEPIAATLPHVFSLQNGSWAQRTSLLSPGFGHQPTTRPFDARELADLVERHTALPDQERNRAALALRRLRDSRERDGEDAMSDRAIDLTIALEAMFMEGERYNHGKFVSGRASWHYADSTQERDAVRNQLKEFYSYRNDVAHGKSAGRSQTVWDMLDKIDNIARACLKTMIIKGRPGDWEASKDFKQIRQNPPRKDTEIPSTKSDSLSWSVAEQRAIDAALVAVWRPEVDNAPDPVPGAVVHITQGIVSEGIERCRREGTAFTIVAPIRLYLAHPMWPKEGEDPDQRVMHYCGQDVERHLRMWHSAAQEKVMHIFELESESPEFFLPRVLPHWRELLQRAGL
ncbi:MAG: HEPN domain-containing protein [Chloroflexi bacterium]|nr:HEPN domain-containing protein [Chloroflexota bacterium]